MSSDAVLDVGFINIFYTLIHTMPGDNEPKKCKDALDVRCFMFYGSVIKFFTFLQTLSHALMLVEI